MGDDAISVYEEVGVSIPPRTEGDNVGNVMSEVDNMLAGCYDEGYIHNNDGCHMERTIPGSKEDRDFLSQLLPYTPRS